MPSSRSTTIGCASVSDEQLSHKGIIPSGLFSSASHTAGGRTVVDQIDGDFSGEERDCDEHDVLGLGTYLPET